MSIILKQFSDDIIIARNGLGAVKICKSNPEFELIFVDMKMPIMNGFDATLKIREFNTKVIIIGQTAFAFEEDKTRVIEAGCNDFISKPIKREALYKIIEKNV